MVDLLSANHQIFPCKWALLWSPTFFPLQQLISLCTHSYLKIEHYCRKMYESIAMRHHIGISNGLWKVNQPFCFCLCPESIGGVLRTLSQQKLKKFDTYMYMCVFYFYVVVCARRNQPVSLKKKLVSIAILIYTYKYGTYHFKLCIIVIFVPIYLSCGTIHLNRNTVKLPNLEHANYISHSFSLSLLPFLSLPLSLPSISLSPLSLSYPLPPPTPLSLPLSFLHSPSLYKDTY